MDTVTYLLVVMVTLCAGDYPPHDLYYRVHYHDLYPKEAPNSKVCIGRTNGAYSHNNLDLGDPRCTYVVCSNTRPIIQSCPRGTRTMYNIRPGMLAHVHHAHHHGHHNNAAFSLPFAISTGYAGSTTAKASTRNQIEAGQVAGPYHVHVYSPMYFNHKMCNIHDVSGVCGNPFPDLNAYSNEIPKAEVMPEG